MSDFAPPSGPPPRVPEGWKAVYNSEYKEWFYVNIYTKQSTWDKPTESAPHPGQSADAPPSGAPPGYSSGGAPAGAGLDSKTRDGPGGNNPYQSALASDRRTGESDEAMARRLQAEEDARTSSRGQSDSYYAGGNQYGGSQQYTQSQSQSPAYQTTGTDRGSGGGGLFGKLKDKLGGGSSGQRYGGSGYPQQNYQQGYGGYGPPQGQYGGGYPQQGYGPPPGMGYGGYGGQQQYMQQPQRKAGMGAGGAAALGVGGGLVGGMLLADMMENHDQNEYNQGYDQGYDQGQDNDMGGGGDMGGGDMGDMGGGDF